MKTKLIITENPKEMVAIGKEIYKEKATIYNDKMVAVLMNTINKNMKDASATEKEDMLYRSIYDYWVYGNNIDEEFYYHYYEKGHKEKSSYLNGKTRLKYIYHLNDKNDAHYLNNKYEAYLELKEFFKRDIIQLSSMNDFELFCDFVEKHPTYVVKPSDLGLAVGVRKATTEKTADKRAAFEALLAEGSRYKAKYKWTGRDIDAPAAIILEEVIDQDDALAKMHPASANGIRCTTVRVENKVHLYYPWFKIGVNGEFVTGGAVGSLLAGINSKTGVVETNGFGETQEEFEFHPTSGVKIPGFKIPKWDELIEMTDKIARHFPNIRYTGWDMVLSKKGWCIMEGNFAGECMWQLMYGKGMKNEFEELIGWKPEPGKFWWE